jgi:predicted phage baseplate assembly protein
VTNPLPATGGADPETRDAARRNAPRTVRTFGRAVSLRDFEDLVTASGEVAKAQATWTWDGLGRSIHLTVAAQAGGMFTEDDLRRLTSALTAARDPNHPLRLANHVAVDVVVRAKIEVEADRRRADVEAAARTALLGALSFDAQQLGRGPGLSDLVRILQDVPGVAFVDVDELGFADAEEAEARRFEPGPVQPRLLVFPARPDETVVGGVRPAELARLGAPTQDATLTASGGLAS